MLEETAGTKWCPFATTTNNIYCVASACMMWVKDGEIGKTPNGQIVTKDLTGNVTWLEDGHCGMRATK